MNRFSYILLKFFPAATSLVIISCSSAPRKEPPDLIPVVFVSGLEIKENYEYYEEWDDLHELFSNNGYSLKISRIPQNGYIKTVSEALYIDITERIFKDSKERKKFHIVAKSMGGLATRRMLFDHPTLFGNPTSQWVRSVTTISTPHRGSEIADLLMSGEQCTMLGKILVPAYTFFFGKNEGLSESGKDLSKARMACFNKEVKLDPTIPFFSMGYKIDCKDALCKILPSYPSPFYAQCWHDYIIKRGGGENDGLVSEESARWGTYLGTFEGEHMAETSHDKHYKYGTIWKEVFQRVIDNLIKEDCRFK